MIIQLHKFGSVLTSRDAGAEAYAAFRPTLNAAAPAEEVVVDFEGVGTLSPSWADEFLSRLQADFGGRLWLLPTQNLSALKTISLLESIRGKKFQVRR